jgi:hypothetical protein
VDAANPTDAQFRKNLILCSALIHAPPPTGRMYVSCARVLRHALIATGLWEDKLADAFHGTDEDIPQFSVVTLWYSMLIELTRQEPESDRLLNGAGNLVTPAGAHFTGCWLTPAGRAAAERLLAENPGWKTKLTADETAPRDDPGKRGG